MKSRFPTPFGSIRRIEPVSKNGIRRNIVTMFGFTKKQGYLHLDRKTAAEQSDSFKGPEKEIAIFTPDEMRDILLAAHARILPLIAIGGFCGNDFPRKCNDSVMNLVLVFLKLKSGPKMARSPNLN